MMEEQLNSNSISENLPILPPLVTKNVLTELAYYKSLLIAVTERIKLLENIIQKNPVSSDIEETSLLINTKSEDLTKENIPGSNTGFVTQKVDYLTNDEDDRLIDKIPEPIKPIPSQKEIYSEPEKKESNTVLFENNIEKVLNESIHSDFITDMDRSEELQSITDNTINTTPENWKPQVPKTLDIVPISLDQNNENKQNSSDEEKPKLVRRGSYVLDTPSPVLLAHLQNTQSSSDYSPTSTSNNIPKRKEWSPYQAKTKWEFQGANRDQTAVRPNVLNKSKKGVSNIPTSRISKSVSNSKTGSPLDLHQSAKSVDCIQSMFAKECYSPKTAYKSVSRISRYSLTTNSTNSLKNNNNNIRRSNKNISTKNENSKLSNSLGNLNSGNTKVVRPLPKNSNSSISKTSSICSPKSNELDVNPDKNKPIITSQKIISVFKEIQEAHKKQMTELVNRQQKEQLLMQDNFKKQQLVLLAQIRKSLPELSISALTEAITGKQISGASPRESMESSKGDTLCEKNYSDQMTNGVDKSLTEKNIEKSPQIYPYDSKENSVHQVFHNKFPGDGDLHGNSCQSPHTIESSVSLIFSSGELSSNRTIDEIPVGPQHRKSSVSRQLFPENKKHVPVFDNSMYTNEHIKAANIINSYARGFLVRRIMKTEKVTALKNTYKEALLCMLRLHVDAPLNLPELNFHQRLQLQCDAASTSIVDLFSLAPAKRMEIIAHDREVKKARSERPNSARSFSFATQRTLARKKQKESSQYTLQSTLMTKSCPVRTRCQTWNSHHRERRALITSLNQGIKRSTSAGAVRRPWR